MTARWTMIDCRPLLPTDYPFRIKQLALAHGKRVVTKGRGPGSLEPDETAGLDYTVVTGDAIVEHALWLWAFYRQPQLAEWVSEAVGEPVEPSPDVASCINVNFLRGIGGRYEKHVDGQPYTLNLFITRHDWQTGGQLDIDGTLVDPMPGFGAAFDGSALPHAVTPIRGGERLTVPMVFLSPSAAARPAGLSDYLYTEKP